MNKLLMAIACAVLVSGTSKAADKTNPAPELVLFITADGFRTDYIAW